MTTSVKTLLGCLCAAFVLVLGCEERKVNKEYAFQIAMQELARSKNLSIASRNRFEGLYSWRFGLDSGVLNTKPANHNPLTEWNAADKAFWRQHWNEIYCFNRNSFETNVFAITGTGTAFDCNEENIPPDTIVLAETTNSGTHWMEPCDFDIATLPRMVRLSPTERVPMISSNDPSGFYVAFADGVAWKLSFEVPFAVLEEFFYVQSAETSSREVSLARWRIMD